MKTSRTPERPKSNAPAAPTHKENALPRIFSVLFGLFFGLALVKFGNLVLVEVWKPNTATLANALNATGSNQSLIDWPTNGWEWALDSWPLVIGYVILIGLIILGVFVARWKINSPRWLVALPLAWLVWEFISATHSIDPRLTGATMKHFAACVGCFYLGIFALGRTENLAGFYLGLLAGFSWVLADGLFQHFGGLEETRRQFFLYTYPTLPSVPPEMLKRLTSNRVFSTLFYPNTLAGALLLCLPILLNFLWELKNKFTVGARALLLSLVGLPALGCLFWSGSKGGWLLMMLLGLIALLRLKFERKWKIALVALVLVCGLAAFAVRFSAYFKKGATSVSARFDYWRAAAQTAAANPVFGTGPGTFEIPYKAIKKPEAEMARLTHNDYLQQASDSGFPGFALYAAAIIGALIVAGQRAIRIGGQSFAIWLGVLGWALQSLMEFGLYIPALAWLAFALLGWLLARPANPFDNAKTNP